MYNIESLQKEVSFSSNTSLRRHLILFELSQITSDQVTLVLFRCKLDSQQKMVTFREREKKKNGNSIS